MRPPPLRRFHQDEQGAEALEMALVLPIYLMTVFVLISFSLVLFGYGNAVYATKLGARYAVVHSSTSLTPCTAAIVQAQVTPMLMTPMASSAQVSTTWGGAGNVIGSTVTVTVKLTYGILPWGFLNNLVAVASTQDIIVH